jgi:hypothetical protein
MQGNRKALLRSLTVGNAGSKTGRVRARHGCFNVIFIAARGVAKVEAMKLGSPRMVARFGIFCGVIAVMSSLPVVSQRLTRPAKSIFGVYGRPTPGQDSIQVAKKSNDRIGVNLKLYYSNGHICQLNKDGRWNGDHVAIVAEGLDPNRPCRLNLFFENNRVLLKDEGFQCAPVYCGTRGKLDDANLPKFSPNRK